MTGFARLTYSDDCVDSATACGKARARVLSLPLLFARLLHRLIIGTRWNPAKTPDAQLNSSVRLERPRAVSGIMKTARGLPKPSRSAPFGLGDVLN